MDALDWADTMADRGAVEIPLASANRDDTKASLFLEPTRVVSGPEPVPVIASDRVVNLRHRVDGVRESGVGAAPAASIFRFARYSIGGARRFM